MSHVDSAPRCYGRLVAVMQIYLGETSPNATDLETPAIGSKELVPVRSAR